MNKGLVVVTGASQGIGKALVIKFMSGGFDVVSCARNLDRLNLIEKEPDYTRGNLITKQVDMSVKDEVIGFGKFILSLDKPVAVLINNVGTFIPGSLIEEEDGQLEKQIETNLYSAYYLTRTLVKNMIERKSGSIFNICSIAGKGPYANGGSYSISKYALLGFSHNLREELKDHGIGVTAVIPGRVLTPSWGETNLPTDTFITSEDVAKAVFDISQLSSNSVVEEILIQPQHK
ncbi:MAG: SDR family NAD(P)-dependent oxidoreductase [Bacteroidetes bacterium]|nr:SDR family NAD(P)-dependent oxidoreductase [Bacteroidota bacterium]MDA1120002.1 SDR family NAD(P)-dependent oxidoreductase [Bacteroidota bacterium]